MAKLLPFSGQSAQDCLTEVSRCIQHNGVISIATESSYALAAGAGNGTAIERVVAMKRDRQAKPILVLIGEKAQLHSLVARIPPGADVLMEQFWPGPLTLVMPAVPGLPESLTCGTGTIGVRQPQSSPLLTVLQSTGPLTGTSANRSGKRPLRSSEDVEKVFGQELDLILDSGPSPGGRPSTVLSLVGEIRLLREGPVQLQAIQQALSGVGLSLVKSEEER